MELHLTQTSLLERQSFSKIGEQVPLPDLMNLQLNSWIEFLQDDTPARLRENRGLEAVFTSVFPIEDNHGNYMLEYVSYQTGLPRYSIDECLDRGVTYSVPLKVKLILHATVEEADPGDYTNHIEQDIFFGNIPTMTNRGSFIINGAERVIVAQLQRSPGVFFEQTQHPNGTRLYSARLIPLRGSWLDITTDIHDAIYAVIDRRRRFPITHLLRAMGFSSNTDILMAFDAVRELRLADNVGLKQYYDKELPVDVIHPETGEILAEAGEKLSKERVRDLKKTGIKGVMVVKDPDDLKFELLSNTLAKDKTIDTNDALRAFYTEMRGGEPPNLDLAEKFLARLLFDPKKYDLGEVGRYRMNKKFGVEVPMDQLVLTSDDIILTTNYLVDMRKGERGTDDIDHLGNRRVRTVGEQLGNQFAVALSRMSRTIRERMNVRDNENLTPQDLVNSRIVTSAISSFFGTNQLSQFLDQTNPLAEVTHKRRLSSLGPGALTRERAGFEVRDVHYTHYGRLCPIETPEGPNIGLISSLASYAVVNRLGFIETPYKKIVLSNGKPKMSKQIDYLSADDEERSNIAQAQIRLDEEGYLQDKYLQVRVRGDFPHVDVSEVAYKDVSPLQIVSPAAACIPFLEHDDANRALMGSNMQRQSVPLLWTEAPIVGTGFESIIARDSRAILISDVKGTVKEVTSDKVLVKVSKRFDEATTLIEEPGMVTFKLKKFIRSNQDTCMNQRPIVKVGQKINIGDILADGMSTDNGELALGKNITVAFMPWRGYNYEDAIVLSENLLKRDTFTTLVVKQVELEVRETKRGEEELTRDIPNVSEEATRNLSKDGIIRIGAEVRPGDILIGKVTPKGETDPTPEEKLLKAIFGEKAGDVKDASKRATPGVKGIVIKTELYTRKGRESRKEEKRRLDALKAKATLEKAGLTKKRNEKLFNLLNEQIAVDIIDNLEKVIVRDGTVFNKEVINQINWEKVDISKPVCQDETVSSKVTVLVDEYYRLYNEIEQTYENDIYKLKVGDDLQPGVIQLAKVQVASKRKVSIGDKLAGRHGNKGIVAAIMPEEDMPFTKEGKPVDIVLNPMGVPSRMNLGQLYETMLGWVGKELGVKFATPVFDGASVAEVDEWMKKAHLPVSGKKVLVDGRTGQTIDSPVTYGEIYMMKLAHQVDDKMHARSTGPYSLITQQPLGGKAQFGGQRFGEMEVWALEAYGAAHTLQEMLTVKSDDVEGRSRVYNAIVKGDNLPEFGVPESFNVLLREMKGLGLDIELT